MFICFSEKETSKDVSVLQQASEVDSLLLFFFVIFLFIKIFFQQKETPYKDASVPATSIGRWFSFVGLHDCCSL